MRAHYCQHVPYEGLGCIAGWLEGRAAEVTATRFFESPRLPDPSQVDLLIIMGGPMSVNDEATLPWLRAEKRFIAEAIAAGKIVLGVCLGAQLIASALGAEVFHWHGETFDLPAGARQIARSEACENQGFAYGERVLGFQFHMETTEEAARAMIEACGNELVPRRWVQTAEEILSTPARFGPMNDTLRAVLDRLAFGSGLA